MVVMGDGEEMVVEGGIADVVWWGWRGWGVTNSVGRVRLGVGDSGGTVCGYCG